MVMVKATRYRDITKAMRSHGCSSKPGKGDHEKWYCSCGQGHMTVITRTTVVSPGLVRQAIRNLPCLPEGWIS